MSTPSHFTTWDDPALLTRIAQVVCSPKERPAFLHGVEGDARGTAAAGRDIDITQALNRSGIPTSNAQVSARYDLANHSVHVRIHRGGTNWKGTVTVEISKT